MKKQYIVIGLGIFGMAIAKTLSEYDVDVIAVDQNETRVNAVSDMVEHVGILDASDKEALQEIGAGDCDTAIIAIGDHLEIAILTILHLKELGVAHIVAKANDNVHAKVLKKVGADEVIQPELSMGERVGKALLSDHVSDVIEIGATHSVMTFVAPEHWIGQTLGQLNLRMKYGMNILGIRRGNGVLSELFDPDQVVQGSDEFVVFAKSDIAEKIDIVYNTKYTLS